MIAFIHIGKTGGTTIETILKEYYPNLKEYHHQKDYKLDEKYIIWIRNPISRFVSAYNYSYQEVNYNCTNKNPEDININNCLCPPRITEKLINKTPYVFSNEYDSLINFFKSANDLAEGLSSIDPIIKEKAINLMTDRFGHIFKGIGWYLNNGIFIKKKNDKILFVGKQETMEEDIKKLSKIINPKLNFDCIRNKNIYSSEESKYLSPLAITNLIEFYKNTDYAALIELNKHGWISDEVLSSYYMYP